MGDAPSRTADRAELLKRLRQKRADSRKGPSPSPRQPDVASQLLQCGIDDPEILQMAADPSSLNSLRRQVASMASSATAASSTAFTEDDEELPPCYPPCYPPARPEDNVDNDDDDDEALPPEP